MRVLPDGEGYVVLDVNGCVMGWISRGRDRRWRSCSVRGHLTHHYSRAGAISAIIGGHYA